MPLKLPPVVTRFIDGSLLIRDDIGELTEELVFTHGDLGDSNIFVNSHDELYFIDFGRGGLADRWMDIAFIHRDLREEVSDTVATDFITSLKQPDNPTKREYYELLDELF